MSSAPNNPNIGARSILIFEPEARGHQSEWLRHLIRYVIHDNREIVVHFVIAEALASEFAFDRLGVNSDRVRLVPLSPREQFLCSHRSLVVSAFSRWWAMRRYLLKTGAEAGHFLALDHLTLPFALGLGMAGRRISGILFRPSDHYRELGPYIRTWREWLRDRRKTALYRLMLRNPTIRRVLLLDPYYSDYARRHYSGGWKMSVVPDPAHPLVNPAPQDSSLADALPSDRINFLLFGFLEERKGMFPLIDALSEMPAEMAGRIGIMMAGRVDDGIRRRLGACLSDLKLKQPSLWIHLEDRRLTLGEVQELVDQVQIVLAPYPRFVGSSGVLLWAAQAGKPVLAPDFGLLGRLVRDHHLGVTVDPTNRTSLIAGIVKLATAEMTELFDSVSARSFVSGRDPGYFAETILANAIDA